MHESVANVWSKIIYYMHVEILNSHVKEDI